MAAWSKVRVLANRAYTRWVANPSNALRPVRVAPSTRPRSARAAPMSSAVIRPDTIAYPSSVSRRATSCPVDVAPGMVAITTTSVTGTGSFAPVRFAALSGGPIGRSGLARLVRQPRADVVPPIFAFLDPSVQLITV